MELIDRPIAITDTETTGLDPDWHEIIEIGLVLLHPHTLDTIDEFESKVKPRHIERATPEALRVNGYNEEEWADAPPLSVAMHGYGTRVREAVFASQNPTFDWPFVRRAFIASRRKFLMEQMDYHRLDTFTLAWSILHDFGLKKFNLIHVAEHLGITPEPVPHRALNGARCAAQVYKKLMLG